MVGRLFSKCAEKYAMQKCQLCEASSSFSLLKLSLCADINNSVASAGAVRSVGHTVAAQSIRTMSILVSHLMCAGVRFIVFLLRLPRPDARAENWTNCTQTWQPKRTSWQTEREQVSPILPLAVGWTTQNKLKATKINYENFHFTFEFLVTCNFVKLMRLFGVPNLIMKMSLCLGHWLALSLCLSLCLALSSIFF